MTMHVDLDRHFNPAIKVIIGRLDGIEKEIASLKIEIEKMNRPVTPKTPDTKKVK